MGGAGLLDCNGCGHHDSARGHGEGPIQDPSYRSGPFIPPRAPTVEPGSGDELRAELERLAAELAHFRTLSHEVADQRDAAQAELRDAREEQVFWERLAAEAEGAKTALAGQLAVLQAQAAAAPPATVAAYVTAANSAAEALELDEAATRRLIDEQLREAGWTVDSANLRHGQGARPQKGRNLAIAEWPTESGPADYALFYGLMPLATVEAKRRLTDIPGALQQAKRTSRGFKPSPETLLAPANYGAAGEYRVPFAFSTNGRPYLRQIETRSGIWFCDLRRPDNLSRPLDGWYSPEGLAALLKQDTAAADAALRTEPFDYGLVLRHYQQAAILAVEAALAAGVRALLIAMATGTGKTKTCSALIYRLLKTGRFRRILFLVDRSALGEQAANAFKETRMEGLQTFADIYSAIGKRSSTATWSTTNRRCRSGPSSPRKASAGGSARRSRSTTATTSRSRPTPPRTSSTSRSTPSTARSSPSHSTASSATTWRANSTPPPVTRP